MMDDEGVWTVGETVTITKKAYEYLVESERWLAALETAGVDSWDGFEFAEELLEEDEWW